MIKGLPLPDGPEWEAEPGPMAWYAQRVGEVSLPTGDRVPLIRLTVWMRGVRLIGFLGAPEAMTFADNLREQAGGLRIATEMPPDPT